MMKQSLRRTPGTLRPCLPRKNIHKRSKCEQNSESITKGMESYENFNSENTKNHASFIRWIYGNTDGMWSQKNLMKERKNVARS